MTIALVLSILVGIWASILDDRVCVRLEVRPEGWPHLADGSTVQIEWPPAASEVAALLDSIPLYDVDIRCEGALVEMEVGWDAADRAALEAHLRSSPVIERAIVWRPPPRGGCGWATDFECPGTHPPRVLFAPESPDSFPCAPATHVFVVIDTTGRISEFTPLEPQPAECVEEIAEYLRQFRFQPRRQRFRPVQSKIAIIVPSSVAQ